MQLSQGIFSFEALTGEVSLTQEYSRHVLLKLELLPPRRRA